MKDFIFVCLYLPWVGLALWLYDNCLGPGHVSKDDLRKINELRASVFQIYRESAPWYRPWVRLWLPKIL